MSTYIIKKGELIEHYIVSHFVLYYVLDKLIKIHIFVEYFNNSAFSHPEVWTVICNYVT